MASKESDNHGSYEKYSGETATVLMLLDLEQKAINLRIQQEAIIAALEEKEIISNGDVSSKIPSIKSNYVGALNEIEKQKKVVGKNKNCDSVLKKFTTSENVMLSKEKTFISECIKRLFD